MQRFLAIVTLCGVALAASAETVVLKDGSRVEGKITAQAASEITVDVNGTAQKLNAEEIKSVDGRPFVCEYKTIYRQKAPAVAPKDAEGHYRLALWCKKNGLKDEMNAELQRALAANPNHEGANLALGMVSYNGIWVRPEDKKLFESREFSRYVLDGKGLTTHAVADLECQVHRLEMLNQWKPTPDQLKKMWPVLNDAEAERLMFQAKMAKTAPEVEAAWTALRSEALKGVVDSFDQNSAVERRARAAKELSKGIEMTMWHKLYKDFADRFMAVLTPGQKGKLMGKAGRGKGGRKGGLGKEERGTQAGVDFLEKVRALSEDEFNAKKSDLAAEALKKFGKGAQTLVGKQEQKTGNRTTEDVEAEKTTVTEIMQRARLENDTDWERRKFNFAAEIEARNQLERLQTIQTNAKKERRQVTKGTNAGRHETEIANILFDGALREVVGMKLGMSPEQMIVKPKADEKVALEFADGQEACQELCTTCHDMQRINEARKSPDAWRKEVAMRLHGSAVDDPKVIAQIADYLVSRSKTASAGKGKNAGDDEDQEDDKDGKNPDHEAKSGQAAF